MTHAHSGLHAQDRPAHSPIRAQGAASCCGVSHKQVLNLVPVTAARRTVIRTALESWHASHKPCHWPRLEMRRLGGAREHWSLDRALQLLSMCRRNHDRVAHMLCFGDALSSYPAVNNDKSNS